MEHPHNVEVEPTELKRAQDTWHGFVDVSKYSLVAIIIIVSFLGITFIDW